MALAAAAILFALYVGNVVMGALSGSAWLNDIQEMLVLLAVSVLFVAGILRREAAAAERDKK